MRRFPLIFLIAVAMVGSTSAHATWYKPSTWGKKKEDNTHLLKPFHAQSEQAREALSTFDQDLEEHLKHNPSSGMYQGKEGIIRTIAKRNSSVLFKNDKGKDVYSIYEFSGGGMDFLENLTYIDGKCIPKLTIASHGWGDSRSEGGNGIPMYSTNSDGANVPAAGIYLNDATRKQELEKAIETYRKAWAKELAESPDGGKAEMAQVRADYEATSLSASANLDDLSDLIRSGKVRGQKKGKVTFCSSCVIQMYGCNTGQEFANKFSAVTGCRVVYGTGNVTGIDTKSGVYDHLWTGDHKNGNKRNGAIFEVTPIKRWGKVVGITEPHQLTTPGKTVWDSVKMQVVPNPLKK